MLRHRPRPRLRVNPATWSSRRRCRPDAPASALATVAGPPVLVESQGFHVVVAVPMLRHRPRPRLRVCRRRCRPDAPASASVAVAGLPIHMDATSSLPSRCSGIGLGRGCGAASASRITGLTRRRCRPDALASASAAVAGLPNHMDATSSLPSRCCGIGLGRGCGAASDSRITGLTRRRCRPDASASAAVAGLP